MINLHVFYTGYVHERPRRFGGLLACSLEWICRWAKDMDCMGVPANHDPDAKPHMIEL